MVAPPAKAPEPVKAEEPEVTPDEQAVETTPPPVVSAEPTPEPDMTPEEPVVPEVVTPSPESVAPKFDVAGMFARGRADHEGSRQAVDRQP